MTKNRKGVIRSTEVGFHAAISDKEFNPSPGKAKGAAARIFGPSTEFKEPTTEKQRFPKKEKGQGVLWSAKHTPPNVDELGATEGNSHLIGPLLGVVANESMARYGELPSSVHNTMLFSGSHPLVDKLKQKGIVKGTPHYSFMRGDDSLSHKFLGDALKKRKRFYEDKFSRREIGEPEIASGSEFTRNLFRDRREKPKTDPNQMKFEGM